MIWSYSRQLPYGSELIEGAKVAAEEFSRHEKPYLTAGRLKLGRNDSSIVELLRLAEIVLEETSKESKDLHNEKDELIAATTEQETTQTRSI